MFKIGDFSRFTRVSVKMLRHYDEIGLLRPAHIDPLTGYRYYSADQLPRLNRIILLKDLGFTLEQIGDLLDGKLTPDQINGMLMLRRAEAEQRLHAEQIRLAQIEARLRHVQQENQHPPYDVIVRPIPAQLMATIRQVAPGLGRPIENLFDEVEAYVAVERARAASSPLTIFHDQEYREENLDVEVAIPVTHALPPGERAAVREIPGAAQMACVVYAGGYQKMPEVLNALLAWMEANTYTAAGPLREVYVRFGAANAEALNLPRAFLTDRPELYVTEVQLPIEKLT